MKIMSNSEFRIPNSERGIRRSQFAVRNSERGMATVLFIALLAIMLMLVVAESRALIQLHREVKLLNVQSTNAVATAISESK